MMDAIDRLYELDGHEVRDINQLVPCCEGIAQSHHKAPMPPPWIEQDITCDQVAAILEGGCASGAYMPAVTYHEALDTMHKHGDAVLQYLEDHGLFELQVDFSLVGESWAGFACKVLSAAVETWAHDVAAAIENARCSA